MLLYLKKRPLAIFLLKFVFVLRYYTAKNTVFDVISRLTAEVFFANAASEMRGSLMKQSKTFSKNFAPLFTINKKYDILHRYEIL